MANLAEDILHLKCFRIVDGKSLIEYFSYVTKENLSYSGPKYQILICCIYRNEMDKIPRELNYPPIFLKTYHKYAVTYHSSTEK